MPKKTFLNLPDDKKLNIIDKIYDAFIENDYNDVTIREITKRTGISIGSFYQYFDDKDDIYLYLLTEMEKRLFEKEREFLGDYLLLSKEMTRLEKVFNKKEIAFNDTFYDAPLEVLQKFYFGEYSKVLHEIYKEDLINLQKLGKIKENIDIDLLFHIYVTSMFNLHTYFRNKNITDLDEKVKIKNMFYKDIMLHGYLKDI
jgi:AcrR family transcriptional regulator